MTDVVLRAPERETPARQAENRSGWESLLFGRKVLNCAECGREVKPLDAYWESSTTVYCSPEHARDDKG